MINKGIRNDQTDQKFPHRTNRIRRSDSNGLPFKLYLEVLVVTDYTIYDDFTRYAQTNNTDLVFLYMKNYFAHYINEVNQRFQNSFGNDPDVRLTIQLKNYLFIKVNFYPYYLNNL